MSARQAILTGWLLCGVLDITAARLQAWIQAGRAGCAMNYGTLPALSWLRSLYLETPPRWPGPMTWPQLAIHMVCVGTPIAWGVRRGPVKS